MHMYCIGSSTVEVPVLLLKASMGAYCPLNVGAVKIFAISSLYSLLNCSRSVIDSQLSGCGLMPCMHVWWPGLNYIYLLKTLSGSL